LIKPLPNSIEFRGILTVGQEFTTGCTPLPGTVAELNIIKESVGKIPCTRLDGDNATSATVLSAMQEHSWVHLACHAIQNTSDPTASAFHLHGGQLDLATITRKSLKNVELAFLSACQTAAGDEKLPNEAIHLAAGMIIAGYHTVIATMWSIKDDDAPLIADYFYSRLMEEGVPDSRKFAKALHNAVGCLRDRVGETEFARWVPYIHIGK
jgi:CHAT domain-containing protein